MHILIVEDDQSVREVLKLVIEAECQAKCFEARDISEALIMMRGVLFDAIVVDYYLDGLTAIPILQLAKEQNVYTIVISASRDVIQNIEEYDVEHFVEKPFSYEKFVEVLDSICIKNI